MAKLSPTIQSIKDEMEKRDWNAMKLAEESGLNFQTVYRVFSGEFVPNLAIVEKMAWALGWRVLVRR
jgi:DNA-binding phage protein